MIKMSAFVVGLLAASAWQSAHAASLFVPDSTFTVDGSDPTTGSGFSDTVSLTPGGPTSLDGGALSLTVSIVPSGGSSEWLVFNL